MKFVRFKTHDENVFSGIIYDDKVIPFDKLKLSRNFLNIMDVILNAEKNDYILFQNPQFSFYYEINDVKILSPFESLAHDIICVGLNYHEHIEESSNFMENLNSPIMATYFSKRAAFISGDSDSIIFDSKLDDAFDYETELAIVIGKQGKNIQLEKAMDYVFGFTILNDLSARNLQKNHGQWFKGKSLDGYTSIGPSIVHHSQFNYPLNLDISTKVNGEIRQKSNTKYMIRNIQSLISELSQGMTLFPGDIIATGTPSGVGLGFSPPKYLKHGDIVECEVEKIGVLKNNIIDINKSC